MKKILVTTLMLLLAVIVSAAQSEDTSKMEAPLAVTLYRGEGEVFPLNSVFLISGDKIKRSFRSDYYLSEGSIELEQGTWSILAVGIGGIERTMYATTDVEIDASPTRCLESLGADWENAFTITCPLRFLNFEVKSGSPLILLIVMPH